MYLINLRSKKIFLFKKKEKCLYSNLYSQPATLQTKRSLLQMLLIRVCISLTVMALYTPNSVIYGIWVFWYNWLWWKQLSAIYNEGLVKVWNTEAKCVRRISLNGVVFIVEVYLSENQILTVVRGVVRLYSLYYLHSMSINISICLERWWIYGEENKRQT